MQRLVGVNRFCSTVVAFVVSFSVHAAVDVDAARILNRIGAQLTGANTAEVNLRLNVKTPTAPTGEGDLAADYKLSVERPNRMALILQSGNVGATFVSDGTNAVTFLPKPAIYTIEKAPSQIGRISGAEATGDMGSMAFIAALFSTNASTALLAGVLDAKYAGRETVDGLECERINMKQDGLDWHLFTSTGTNALVRRIEVTIPQLSMSMDFTGWKLNAVIPADRFAFTPPAGAKKVERLLADDDTDGEDSDLVGEPFPRLKLKTVDGQSFDTISLNKKNALLVIWAGEADHCAQALKAAVDLAATRKAVAVVSINIDEKPDKARIKSFLGNLKIKTALDRDGQVIDNLAIDGVPMTFLVDQNGVIRKAFLGYHSDFKTLVAREIDALAK